MFSQLLVFKTCLISLLFDGRQFEYQQSSFENEAEHGRLRTVFEGRREQYPSVGQHLNIVGQGLLLLAGKIVGLGYLFFFFLQSQLFIKNGI